ncbi:MAG: hypothetical protein R3E48_18445 [Burkholderiaceae bacterium]
MATGPTAAASIRSEGFSKIHFVDVRAAATLRGVAPGTRIELETADGVGLSLGSLDRAAKADARWIRVTARPLRAEAKAATQKIVDRVTGFDFLLGAQAAEALGWQTSGPDREHSAVELMGGRRCMMW